MNYATESCLCTKRILKGVGRCEGGGTASSADRSLQRHTGNSLQTLDEDLHVPLTGGLVEIEVGASTAHFIAPIGEGLVHMVLGHGALLLAVSSTRNGGSKKGTIGLKD